MNTETIVGQIDAEIEKLQRIRAIFEELLTPKPQVDAKPRPASLKPVPVSATKVEPRIIVVPPKERREYKRRVKPINVQPNALSAPVSSLPVFVPKAVVRQAPGERAASADSVVEAAIRRKLLGGVV